MSQPSTSRTTCPRCGVAAIIADTATCEVCGFKLDTPAVVEREDVLATVVTRQLSHEFELKDVVGRRDGTLIQRAIEKAAGRRVLLKVLQRRVDQPESEVRFRSVMDAFSQLDHPNLVPIFRYGVTDSLLWFAMQDVGAEPLRNVLRRQQRFEPREARRIATQIVSALEYLHRRGLVHGDVKPENVLIDPQGWVRLAEPAFARTQGQRSTWMAPEDAAGAERSPSSDQFALAALMFECVAGEPPLEPGEQVARFRPEVPQAMSNAIARALDAQMTRRFSSCSDFLFALEQSSVTGSMPVVPVATTAAARPSGRMSTDALLIHDWEPPETASPARNAKTKLVVGIAIGIAIALAVPFTIKKVQESRTPQAVSSPVPLTLPSTTDDTPAPSAARITGDVPAAAPEPARTEIIRNTPAPSSTRSVAAPTRNGTRETTRESSTASTAAARNETPAPAPTRPAPAPAAAPAAAEPAAGTASGVTGKLTVNANPWGQVFVDDRLIGNTPRANIELPAGTHTLRVSRQGFETVTRQVSIKAGETLRITDIVLTPVSP